MMTIIMITIAGGRIHDRQDDVHILEVKGEIKYLIYIIDRHLKILIFY